MNKLLITIIVLLFSSVTFAQQMKVKNTNLVFEFPNEYWSLNSEQDVNGMNVVIYKRSPIEDDEGRQIIPNISIITEDVKDNTDLIMFSVKKRATIPFKVNNVFSHDSEGAILKYTNAIGYQGSYMDKNELEHAVYVIHLIQGTTGVQIIMDLTESIYMNFGEEFRATISSIREN